MPEPELLIRRCRRTDFTAVMRLVAGSGSAVPPPDRRTLRRFRAIVNDLGCDLYVCEIDGAVTGVVHAAYTRQLVREPRACISGLLVDEGFRRRGIGTALFRFVRERAIRRGCGTLDYLAPTRDAPAAGFLEKIGLRPVRDYLFVDTLGREDAPDDGNGNR